MNITLRFSGGRELSDALGKLSQRVAKKVGRDALKVAAEPMRKSMAALAPVGRTRVLRDSMSISNARGQLGEIAVAVGPSKDAFYGLFQEFGTVRHSAQPFARPAFDTTQQQVLDELSIALWEELVARSSPGGR